MQENKIDFSINADNFKSIPLEKYPKNFSFIVNGKPYETSRIVADLLSPIVRKYHYEDESQETFVINTKHQTQDEIYFPSFLELFNFSKTFQLNKTEQEHYKEYFLRVGNISEYLRLIPELFIEASPDNVIEKLNEIFEIFNEEELNSILANQKVSESPLNVSSIEKLINVASSHFYEISASKISLLKKTVIEMIISNDSLKIEDEDSLLRLILDLYEKDREYSSLFEYVRFNNVSKTAIEEFVSKFSMNDIDGGIWKSLCERLINAGDRKDKTTERYRNCDENQKNKENEKKKFVELKYSENHEFEGIMNYLSEKTNGNIHDNGTIEITSNSCANDSNSSPKFVVDYQKNDDQHIYRSHSSSNEPNSTIIFDFKNMQVQPSDYAIQSCKFGNKNYCHLKNWIVEVSNDKNEWKIIDSRENDASLNDKGAKSIFKCNCDNFYRYVQLRQTGNSWYNNGYLYINLIEFFGKLKE